jgi:hypothetical protein
MSKHALVGTLGEHKPQQRLIRAAAKPAVPEVKRPTLKLVVPEPAPAVLEVKRPAPEMPKPVMPEQPKPAPAAPDPPKPVVAILPPVVAPKTPDEFLGCVRLDNLSEVNLDEDYVKV